MLKERTTITLPRGLRDRAHAFGINISGLTADAIERAIKNLKEEKETGANLPGQTPATATCEGRASECQLQTC